MLCFSCYRLLAFCCRKMQLNNVCYWCSSSWSCMQSSNPACSQNYNKTPTSMQLWGLLPDLAISWGSRRWSGKVGATSLSLQINMTASLTRVWINSLNGQLASATVEDYLTCTIYTLAPCYISALFEKAGYLIHNPKIEGKVYSTLSYTVNIWKVVAVNWTINETEGMPEPLTCTIHWCKKRRLPWQ